MVVQVPITSTLLDLVEVEAVALVEIVMGLVEVTVHLVHWKKQSLGFQEMTIPYLLKYLKHPSCVMARLMVATMLTQKLGARLSTSVPTMEMVEEQNTVSSVLMELSSNSNTLFVTGGSMLTVLWLNLCIPLMMKMLRKELLTLQKVQAVLVNIKEDPLQEEEGEVGDAVDQGVVVGQEVAVDQVALRDRLHLQEDHTLHQAVVAKAREDLKDLEMVDSELMLAMEHQELVATLSVDTHEEMPEI